MESIAVEIRKCKQCGDVKPLDGKNFASTFSTKYNKRYYEYKCRSCARKRYRDWHLSNVDHNRAMRRAWYIANSAICKARTAARKIEKKLIKGSTVKTRKRIPQLLVVPKTETIKMREDRWLTENPDIARELARQKTRIRQGRYPDRRRARNRNYKAKKRSVLAERITAKQMSDLLIKQRCKCAICRIDLGNYHVDHIQPLSKGGLHQLKNLQLLCPPCNIKKRDCDPIEYMQKVGFLL